MKDYIRGEQNRHTNSPSLVKELPVGTDERQRLGWLRRAESGSDGVCPEDDWTSDKRTPTDDTLTTYYIADS